MPKVNEAVEGALEYKMAGNELVPIKLPIGEDIGVNKYLLGASHECGSLIPAFCGKGYYGLKVHKAALDYGVKVTGATVHFVNEIPDGGKIILQKSVMIRKDETPESLQVHVMKNAEWIILPRAVEMVAKRIRKGGELEE